MTQMKLARRLSAMVLILLIGRPVAAQSLNWVHQSTGVAVPPIGMSPADDVGIGFTGPWVNVFYNIGVGENIEVRGIRQFPVNDPNNNTQYIPFPAPLATVPSTVDVDLLSERFLPPGTMGTVGLLVRTDGGPTNPSRLFLISAGTPQPVPPTILGVESFAWRPNAELVTFDADDLEAVGLIMPGMVVGAGATDLDVALVDFELVNPQNNIFDIRYRQTTFGTGQFLPPVVVASVPGLNPDSIGFAMTAGGIPHIVYSHPGAQQVISRQFDPKFNAWTTSILDTVGQVIPYNSIVAQGENVAATWATANPNNPNAPELDLRVALREGSGDWQVSTVCTACVGNPEQLDITFSPDGFPVIAYVSPTNQLMVAFDPLLPQPVDGDYNGDGRVDAADYTLWRDGLGSTYGPEDYTVWKANFGATLGSAANSSSPTVPEPGAFTLSALALLPFARRLRRAAALHPGTNRVIHARH